MSELVKKPKSDFTKKYIKTGDRWVHVYIISTYFQMSLEGEIKMVEYRLSKNSNEVYTAERDKFFDNKPSKSKKSIDNNY